ncbi:MAG: hypothetical protein KJ621_09965 [Proteobacteria bacterium]|nr:hypothetical protein [Pseudomonadota bacterium]MBU1740058.1 hypothetical protein [Pseudomonadota bacterium]
MMDRPVFVFVDDAPFELENFRANIAPAAPDVEFVYDSTFDGACQKLGDRPVHLFLLDLFGSDPAASEPRIPPRQELAAQVKDRPTLTQVYAGLDASDPANINEYLRRLFAVVDGWRQVFSAVCDQVGQNRNYGLGNLTRAEAEYPLAAKAAYTRKALFADAAACFSAGFDGLFMKPPGKNDADIAANSKRAAPGLLAAWSDLAEKRLIRGCREKAEAWEAQGGPADLIAASRRLAQALAGGDKKTALAAARALPPDEPIASQALTWLDR